ncbi:MAG: hypothetical protein IJQ82_11390 [Selenomonadaceae bacterium]|nr:hypothetical protein [Selenomonadaceae bacterium]
MLYAKNPPDESRAVNFFLQAIIMKIGALKNFCFNYGINAAFFRLKSKSQSNIIS